jgi:hypothetical protein
MLIGNKQTFAVEYELNNDYGGEWMYGKICYWIENQEIGNYQLGTSLRDVLFGLKYILYDSGNRTDTHLCQTLPEDVFYQINVLIYRVEEDNFNHSLEAPARFEVSINVDVFDGWKIFLIDCIDFSIILFKSINDEKVKYSRLQKGEFDDAICKLSDDLERIYESTNTRQGDPLLKI